tara:strand:- start:237 stop:464 length:228 start_codon:yes stop_codon:yes gene_type:complete
MALLVTFPAPRLVASRLLSGRSLRTVGGRHHQKAFGLHARASAADKQAETKVEYLDCTISGTTWLIVSEAFSSST